MTNIKILLEEFKNDMLQKFIDHDKKWGDGSIIRYEWEGEIPFDEEYLRKEIHYHYAKWLYRGVEKKTLPEEDTLTNLANTILLLWIKVRNKREGIINIGTNGKIKAVKKKIEVEVEFAKEDGEIQTLEGVVSYKKGDAIITGIKGEKYPCRRDIFDESYEIIERYQDPFN